MTKKLFILALVLISASCSHVISKEVRDEAVSDVSFKKVRKNIEKHKGSVFIWGGFIAKTTIVDDGTEITIVQNPIDKYGDIIDPDISYGRFIAIHPEELDPLIYERSRFVTVAGELTGGRQVTRKGKEYVYPLLKVREIHLWKDEVVIYTPVTWMGYPPDSRPRPGTRYYGIHPLYYYRY